MKRTNRYRIEWSGPGPTSSPTKHRLALSKEPLLDVHQSTHTAALLAYGALNLDTVMTTTTVASQQKEIASKTRRAL
jgi:hypothetical protein